jgi:hypothetical protein
MNATNKLIAYIFAALILFTVGAFIGVKLTVVPEPPQYSTADSIRNASIDSVKGEYQQVIDSLQKVKQTIRWRTKEYKKIADSLSLNADSVCAPVIAAKDNEIKSLNEDLINTDIEAQLYSAMLDSCEIQRFLDLKRFKTLKHEMDSSIVSYQDSLKYVRKQSDKAIKKEKRTTLFYKVTTTLAAALGIYGTIR